MPRSPDCVIVGGGVVGLTAARRLARDGAAVTLLERAECGREASWAGAGILAPCNPHRDDPIFHLHRRSLAAYPSFCAELFRETGIDPEYDASGALEILLTEQAMRIAQSDVRAAAGRFTQTGLSILELHAAEETGRLEPAVTPNLLGSLECRQTALVRNPRLVSSLRAACLNAGVEIREHSAVTDVVDSGGRVTGVRLAHETVHAGAVVLCAGAWSSGLTEKLAPFMPIHPVRGQIVLVKLAEPRFRRVISHGKFYAVPRRDGHVLLGSTEEPEAGFTKRNTPQGILTVVESAIRVVPELTAAPMIASWSGLRPGTPDDKPYLGPIPGLDGCYAATGHFRAGITLAPITADILSAWMGGRSFDLDLSGCAPGRRV